MEEGSGGEHAYGVMTRTSRGQGVGRVRGWGKTHTRVNIHTSLLPDQGTTHHEGVKIEGRGYRASEPRAHCAGQTAAAEGGLVRALLNESGKETRGDCAPEGLIHRLHRPPATAATAFRLSARNAHSRRPSFRLGAESAGSAQPAAKWLQWRPTNGNDSTPLGLLVRVLFAALLRPVRLLLVLLAVVVVVRVCWARGGKGDVG